MVRLPVGTGGTSNHLDLTAMQPALHALIERYCLTLEGQMKQLTGLMADFALAAEHGRADVTAPLDLAHRIAGIAGSMGYPAVSDAAAALERAFRTIDKADGATSSESADAAAALFSCLQEAARGATPEMSTLHSADLDWLDAPARSDAERT